MSWVIAKKETLSEKEVEQTLRAQDAIAKAVRRVEQQFAKEKLTKKARWGESGFWLSPDGVLTNFPYPSTQHAEAIDEGLLQLPPQLQQQLEDSGTPVEDLIKHGWTRGIVNSDEVYVEVADESHVSPSLSRLPFLAPKLLVDIFNNPNGYFALMLNEGEDLESAWRNRNRPRVFASLEESDPIATVIHRVIDPEKKVGGFASGTFLGGYCITFAVALCQVFGGEVWVYQDPESGDDEGGIVHAVAVINGNAYDADGVSKFNQNGWDFDEAEERFTRGQYVDQGILAQTVQLLKSSR